jgi:hypothetical protein
VSTIYSSASQVCCRGSSSSSSSKHNHKHNAQ